ncbi:hypothetical protein TcasGA2_TC010080 [Tribolium castaneum]|uniref:Uncharacterized protein n=1 Tax=Tribolium castaneum TaxID=7070 RepID=D6WS67_TRICA|nr:hypothetical protein TcasGA2_TC010080 [Tribolium castaneum]
MAFDQAARTRTEAGALLMECLCVFHRLYPPEGTYFIIKCIYLQGRKSFKCRKRRSKDALVNTEPTLPKARNVTLITKTKIQKIPLINVRFYPVSRHGYLRKHPEKQPGCHYMLNVPIDPPFRCTRGPSRGKRRCCRPEFHPNITSEANNGHKVQDRIVDFSIKSPQTTQTELIRTLASTQCPSNGFLNISGRSGGSAVFGIEVQCRVKRTFIDWRCNMKNSPVHRKHSHAKAIISAVGFPDNVLVFGIGPFQGSERYQRCCSTIPELNTLIIARSGMEPCAHMVPVGFLRSRLSAPSSEDQTEPPQTVRKTSIATIVPSVIIVKKINGRERSVNHLIVDNIIVKVVIVSPCEKTIGRIACGNGCVIRTPPLVSSRSQRTFGVAEQKEGRCVSPLMLHCVQRTARPVITFTSHHRCETEFPPPSPPPLPSSFFSRRQLGTAIDVRNDRFLEPRRFR